MYKGTIWLYGSGRVNIANERMCRYYSAGDENFKRAMKLAEVNPLAVLVALYR